MLMRTDPFRELDRVAQQVLGTAARPAAMPIDAYRKGDEFVELIDEMSHTVDELETRLRGEVAANGAGGDVELAGEAVNRRAVTR